MAHVEGVEGTVARVETVDELRRLLGSPDEAVAQKVIDRLDHHCRSFIERSPFVIVATTGANGTVDASPRGGPAGFVEVLDEHRLVYAEAKGNLIADSLRNILATGRAGLLFVVPGLGETLRVNGRASLTTDPAILARHVVQEGKPPKVAVLVTVEEAFLHCAKAFIRSSLWQPESWPSREGMARPAQVWRDHIALAAVSLEDVEELVEESYRNELY
jgi:PPOX class probable FMN-dependent enzyme